MFLQSPAVQQLLKKVSGSDRPLGSQHRTNPSFHKLLLCVVSLLGRLNLCSLRGESLWGQLFSRPVQGLHQCEPFCSTVWTPNTGDTGFCLVAVVW